VRLDDVPGVASHASIRVRRYILVGRGLARATFRMYPRERSPGEVHVGVITDGSAPIAEAERTSSRTAADSYRFGGFPTKTVVPCPAWNRET
jgi:hypothetical protein